MLTDPKALAALQYGPQAAFLGVDPSELAGLTPAAISKKVDDKLSLYEQKSMGYGVEDQRMAQFRQQFQLGEPLARTAQRAQDATDRRRVRAQPETRSPTLDIGQAAAWCAAPSPAWKISSPPRSSNSCKGA